MNETILMAQVLSVGAGDPEVLAGLGAAASLAISDVPFNGPMGYTLGAGVEAKVGDNVSRLAEYAFTDLGDPIVFSTPAGFAAFDLRESMRFHTIKMGVNYRF